MTFINFITINSFKTQIKFDLDFLKKKMVMVDRHRCSYIQQTMFSDNNNSKFNPKTFNSVGDEIV